MDPSPKPLRHLILVLGDQLDNRSPAFEGFDRDCDAVWMAENQREATHVWCHKLRLAFFFSAMRHFRDELRKRDVEVHYHELTPSAAEDRGGDFSEILERDARDLRPRKLVVVRPGDWRVLQMLRTAAGKLGVELQVREDTHFYGTLEDFRTWAEGRKSLLMEHFYEAMRKNQGVLVTPDGKPDGGRWNFDSDNREAFGRDGPGKIKRPRRFGVDRVTEDVLRMVATRFHDHPGSAARFDLPVTREQALAALRDFLEHRLRGFGRFEDALWTDEPFLHHSRLSAALNTKLLDPRECVDRAVDAYREDRAPLNDVEGFVRQLLGWREFVRGIYWLHMPDYAEMNDLGCPEESDVPSFYWDGETDMRCVREAMTSVLTHGYTHHIARLMVLGLFAQLLGVHPRKFHEWHMAMYVDAVDWVSLPNTLGMSQFGDGGIVGTKPYCASGNYIHRMSNYCGNCRYDPKAADSESACPFTALYWDFLARHRKRLGANRRMSLQLRNLERKSPSELDSIRRRARQIAERVAADRRI